MMMAACYASSIQWTTLGLEEFEAVSEAVLFPISNSAGLQGKGGGEGLRGGLLNVKRSKLGLAGELLGSELAPPRSARGNGANRAAVDEVFQSEPPTGAEVKIITRATSILVREQRRRHRYAIGE